MLSVETLDLTHVSQERGERPKRTLTKFDDIWNGYLGEINIVMYLKIFQCSAQLFMQHPYRSRSKTREDVAKEFERICKAILIEVATSK